MAWIIKDNRKKFKIRCDSCNSIIGFTKKDVIVDGGEYLGEIYSYSSIRCPACDNKITLSIDGKEVTSIETLD